MFSLIDPVLLFKTIIYLGTKTVSCRLLQWIRDGHLLKLEKRLANFSKFNAMPAKSRQKNYYCYCSLIECVSNPIHNFTGAFCVYVKALSNDFNTELT